MNLLNQIKITETPRDALQGWPRYVPVEMKAKFINAILKVGFETVDCGSFVSAKAVPQMADTGELLKLLDLSNSSSNLMVITGNLRGGQLASAEGKVHTIAYPYSVSGTFLQRNLNTTADNAWKTMPELQKMCDNSGKKLRVYLTMAFGNPYGDPWSDEQVSSEVEKLYKAGIYDLVLSDTTGEGTPETIGRLCKRLISAFPAEQLGIHLHSRPDDWQDKLDAAWYAGIRRFESALGGYGGCPMTGFELCANINTLDLSGWCQRMHVESGLDEDALKAAQSIAFEVFV